MIDLDKLSTTVPLTISDLERDEALSYAAVLQRAAGGGAKGVFLAIPAESCEMVSVILMAGVRAIDGGVMQIGDPEDEDSSFGHFYNPLE